VNEDIEDLFEDIPETAPEIPKTVPIVRKSEMSKLIKDVLTTRKTKPIERAVDIVPSVTTEKSQMERMFTQQPPKPPKLKPVPVIVKGPEKIPVPPEIAAIIAQEMEIKPIPTKVSKKQKMTFGQKLKSLTGISRIRGKIKSKEREIKTGLTARQRIKRYNSIHEGGYGVPSGEKVETENGS
jgi:hypothetical protein